MFKCGLQNNLGSELFKSFLRAGPFGAGKEAQPKRVHGISAGGAGQTAFLQRFALKNQ